MRMHGRRYRVCFGVLALGLLCLPLAAQSGRSVPVDYAKVNLQIQGFERAITDEINKAFNPWGLQKPKGAYLPGYGFMFTFLLNIRYGTATPFGNIPDDVTPSQKKQRIEGLKEKLMQILLDQGKRMDKLQKGESISITAFFEERNPLNSESDVNKTLILSVLQSDLDESILRQEGLNEFKHRVKIVEY